MIASNRERASFPSCRNQWRYISKSVVSVYANQDSGEAVVSFCWTVLPFKKREPLSQMKAAVVRRRNTDGCWAAAICPCPSSSWRNPSAFISKNCRVPCLNLLKVDKEIGSYLPRDFQWNVCYCCLIGEPAPPFLPLGVKWRWGTLVSAVIHTTSHISDHDVDEEPSAAQQSGRKAAFLHRAGGNQGWETGSRARQNSPRWVTSRRVQQFVLAAERQAGHPGNPAGRQVTSAGKAGLLQRTIWPRRSRSGGAVTLQLRRWSWHLCWVSKVGSLIVVWLEIFIGYFTLIWYADDMRKSSCNMAPWCLRVSSVMFLYAEALKANFARALCLGT